MTQNLNDTKQLVRTSDRTQRVSIVNTKNEAIYGNNRCLF